MIRGEFATIYMTPPSVDDPLLDRVEFALHWMYIDCRAWRELPTPSGETVLYDPPSLGRQRLYVELARLYEWLVA